jgi:hypothetical protein
MRQSARWYPPSRDAALPFPGRPALRFFFELSYFEAASRRNHARIVSGRTIWQHAARSRGGRSVKWTTRKPCRSCIEAVAVAIEKNARILRRASERLSVPSVSGRLLALRASEREHVAKALRRGAQ